MGSASFDSTTTAFDSASVAFDALTETGGGAVVTPPVMVSTSNIYRVLCADLVSNTIREELAIHDLRYSWVLDAPGAMSGWLSLDDPKALRANLDPGATAIYVERGGALVWGGIMWTAPNVDDVTRKVTIGAEGFWSYFRRRRLRVTKTYLQVDQLAIAQDMMNYALAQPGSLNPITVGTETSPRLRDRTYYQYDRKNLGQLVEQLAAVIDGFDFSIDVAWDSAGTTPVRTFHLYYPRRGSRIPSLIFDRQQTGVTKMGVNVDATATANLIDAIGAGDGDAKLISTAADTSLFSRYPLLEDTVSFIDVNEAPTLDGHAVAQLGRLRLPVELPSFEKQAGVFPDFNSFGVGDEGLVRGQDGWININGYYRIQSLEIRLSDNGQEIMVPTFVSVDASVN